MHLALLRSLSSTEFLVEEFHFDLTTYQGVGAERKKEKRKETLSLMGII